MRKKGGEEKEEKGRGEGGEERREGGGTSARRRLEHLLESEEKGKEEKRRGEEEKMRAVGPLHARRASTSAAAAPHLHSSALADNTIFNVVGMLLVSSIRATGCSAWAPNILNSQYSTGIQYNIFITLNITRTRETLVSRRFE